MRAYVRQVMTYFQGFIRAVQTEGLCQTLKRKPYEDLKTLAIFLAMVPIFGLLNRPLWGEPHVLTIGWDGQLPRIDGLIWVYHTWMPLLLGWTLMLLCQNRRLYARHIRALILGQTMAYLTFLCFQTQITVREAVIGSGLTKALLRWTYIIDNHYAGFPSVHVTLATVACLSMAQSSLPRGVKALFIAYEGLIMASTVLVDQHVLLDLFSGWIYGGLAWVIAGYWLKRMRMRMRMKRRQHEDHTDWA